MKAKIFLPVTALLAVTGAPASAQAVPATPTKFTTKPIGGATSTTGASINPAAPKTVVRQITYLTLSPLQQWNSADGTSRMGKLIAWEETVVTTDGTRSAAAPQSAPITTKPTVLKNNKARLLIDNKAYEVPLDRLGAGEQKFIQDLQAAIAAKP